MIVIKETDGILLVADIGPSRSDIEPGELLRNWVPIGPGIAPVLTWDGDTCFVTFDYLGRVYVRRLDVGLWPPQVIDPVTHTPSSFPNSPVLITVQEPQEAVGFGLHANLMDSRAIREYMPGVGRMVRTSTMYYDPATDVFSTTVTRNATIDPTPATRKKWRAWIRPLGGGTWALLQDWVVELPDLPLSGLGSLKVEVACTYGHLWTEEARNTEPNLSGSYEESQMGHILVIDSDLEGRTWQSPPEEIISLSPGTPVDAEMDSKIQFAAANGIETLGIGLQTSTSVAVYLDPGISSPFHASEASEALELAGGNPGHALLYS